jgi:putative glycosyltransferase (TIGR04372 family)
MYRFKSPSRPGYASHHIEQLEPLCRKLQESGHKGFLIFIHASATSNLELSKIYATHFNLYLDDRTAFLRTIFTLMPKFGFINTFLNYSYYDQVWLLPPAEKLGTIKHRELPKVISESNLEPFKYVVVTHRSDTYDAKYHKNSFTELNRSTDINKAKDAIRLIDGSGLKIVRMGLETDELPSSLRNLPIVDLSGKFRSDIQDLWLAEHCLFLWCINDNGTWHFANKYNRPTIVTNTYTLIRGYQHSLFTFQLIWDEGKNRHLSLTEMSNLRGIVGRVSEMNARGLTFVENSSAELVASVSEMISFTNEKLEFSKQDLSLLTQFSKLLVSAGYPPKISNHSQPCISFLRKYQNLLG